MLLVFPLTFRYVLFLKVDFSYFLGVVTKRTLTINKLIMIIVVIKIFWIVTSLLGSRRHRTPQIQES